MLQKQHSKGQTRGKYHKIDQIANKAEYFHKESEILHLERRVHSAVEENGQEFNQIERMLSKRQMFSTINLIKKSRIVGNVSPGFDVFKQALKEHIDSLDKLPGFKEFKFPKKNDSMKHSIPKYYGNYQSS